MEYELRTIHDGRKSFYKKAYVIENDGVVSLRSYQTIVCEIIEGKPQVYGTYSNTTLRHIKEFLKQHGFKAENSSQILNDYPEVEKPQRKPQSDFIKTTSLIASLGDLFGNNQKDSNDWKARMLKAGLEPRGLIMPEDWESLTEEEKEKRLNLVIEMGIGK